MVVQTHLSDGNANPIYALGRCIFYIDNFVTSVDTVTEATQVYEMLTNWFQEARVNLRDWCSSNSEFDKVIPSNKSLQENLNSTNVLGLTWDQQTDKLSLSFEERPVPSHINICSALQILASVYDPLGLVAPHLVDLKLFIQDCWKQKNVSIDDTLPVEFGT